MQSFEDRVLEALQAQRAVADLAEQRRFAKELAKSLEHQNAVLRASVTQSRKSILGLINLARESGDQDEAVWRCFLATHFREYMECGGETTDSAFKFLCALGAEPYWTWQRFYANPYALRDWLSEHRNELRQRLVYGNHRKFEPKTPAGLWEIIASFLKLAEEYQGPARLASVGDAVKDDAQQTFHLLFTRFKEGLWHFDVLGSFDFVVLLRDMKLVRAEPHSCYLIDRSRKRGALAGAIKLWGHLSCAPRVRPVRYEYWPPRSLDHATTYTTDVHRGVQGGGGP